MSLGISGKSGVVIIWGHLQPVPGIIMQGCAGNDVNCSLFVGQ